MNRKILLEIATNIEKLIIGWWYNELEQLGIIKVSSNEGSFLGRNILFCCYIQFASQHFLRLPFVPWSSIKLFLDSFAELFKVSYFVDKKLFSILSIVFYDIYENNSRIPCIVLALTSWNDAFMVFAKTSPYSFPTISDSSPLNYCVCSRSTLFATRA